MFYLAKNTPANLFFNEKSWVRKIYGKDFRLVHF